MNLQTRSSLARALAALAVTLALSAPAAADPWHGYPGMGPGYPAWEGYRGWGDADQCPYLRNMPAPAPTGGKMLGVSISDLPNALLDALNLGYGVSVEDVRPDTPAAAAGLRAGDVIVAFAGKPVISAERLRWLVRKAEPGKALEIKVLREGAPLTLSVTLPEAKPRDKSDTKDAPKLGT